MMRTLILSVLRPWYGQYASFAQFADHALTAGHPCRHKAVTAAAQRLATVAATVAATAAATVARQPPHPARCHPVARPETALLRINADDAMRIYVCLS
ncbi:uncharacterized protein SPSK_08180 [Sporothrix schenckii 1099-18]|uniref:Uncharacterized protein n=1 Tax=Sporothrix schenckii 1099-18 TaxID=1397361 RepID=A0A0F2MGY3_SPOSC|nr:uncharacterized protein SPSK_08180 [Sporothrix schenckii 1099-18]KJR88902.1 hypothetical protein SPSK_08180 [Sporothrix schenckii 1099-18]